MSKAIESVELRYQEGTSDKVYQASIESAGCGYVVNFAYGRRGAALNTGTKTQEPVTLDEAMSVYNKLVKSKTAKGYCVHTGTAGSASICVADNAGEDTGLRPQLLNAVDAETAEAYIRHPSWCVQEKFDGRRMLIRKRSGIVTAANRRGLAVACPEAVAAALVSVQLDFVIDGELVGDKYHCFDMLEYRSDMRGLCYIERLAMLDFLFGAIASTAFAVVETVCDGGKAEFVRQLRADGREGAVFKHMLLPWSSGRPASNGPALKLKFWESCSCVVSGINKKRSVELSMGGRCVGNVTIPPNHPVPKPGQVVEIRYLYVTGGGGSLYQPVYLGVRDDIDPSECTVEAQRLKYKAAA